MFAKLAHVVRFISSHHLTRRHRAEAFLRFANFQLKARLNEEIIFPWIGDTRLAVRRGMTGATGNIYAGLHDFSEMAFLLHFLRPGDLFYDVGANVGTYTVLASGVCQARSLAFEPDPSAAAALRRNVEVNGLADLVTVQETAVGAAKGVANFTIGLDTGNRILMEGSIGARKIEMTTLDESSVREKPTLLKMDVEGFNYQVVEGAKTTLASENLKAIIIEWPSEVINTLTSLGFQRIKYNPLSRGFQEYSDQEQQPNTLFIRNVDFVGRRVADANSFSVLEMEF
jgi:FkbM family methyltransferase